MPTFSATIVAAATMMAALISVSIGAVLTWRGRIGFRFSANIIGYGTTIAPLLIVLWNCVALTLDAVFGWQVKLSTSDPNPVYGDVMVGYSIVYSFVHLTSDYITAYRNQAVLASQSSNLGQSQP